MAHDRHAPIVQPTPRPGIEYIRDEGGLPSARRIPVQHGLPSPTHQVDSPQGSSYSEASPIDEWQNPQYYSSRSGGAQDRGRGRI
ncbi:hypothetical protein SERLADRAFT_391118 [Serpula lacrymans var. lacrymans S7.9]|uniref:Uncharacterized protein n=1 Tax=Serpula lacrymans var. lacrymans (strain S7.9) TaxID=578457 RepID=F8NWK9_SERL9|nr:uncharacterized protein SERLADRAFT_391118 [Serpula lacrymans var. lacrymans S7.9]EGO25034.1 hypothetical protein SERLADRAFT_391118 [Serpula lacrymans var. lacrymans S7.9]